MSDLIDYPCDECGYEGPHTYVGMSDDGDREVHECGECYCEFEVTR